MTTSILEKILVAVDFSAQSDIALEQAILIATPEAEITVLSVEAEPQPSHGGLDVFTTATPEIDNVYRELRQQATDRLQKLADRVRARGIAAVTRLESGHPDEVIVDVAAEMSAAVIVLGTKGLTGFKRLLLGSVAEKVVRAAATNVLVARGESKAFARILVPTDFSPASEHALQWAVALSAPGARIDLLHAWQYPPGTHGIWHGQADDGPLGELRKQLVTRIETLGAAMCRRYSGASRTVEFVHDFGAATAIVHERLESHSYDLVAMGTHGYRGVRRFLLGSVAEATVRHAPCSVLVVHPAAAEPAA